MFYLSWEGRSSFVDWMVAGGDWFVLRLLLCVLRDVFLFPKGHTFCLDLLCHIADFEMCLIQLC